MKNLNDLIDGVLAEAKRQENQRKEYLSLVHGLIEGTEREELDFPCVRRISFRWYSDKMGGEMISFSSNVSGRNSGLSAYDMEQLEKSKEEIDRCINYLLDCGKDVADAFIEYLSMVAIPQFLQRRYPQTYEVKRDIYTAMYRSRKTGF